MRKTFRYAVAGAGMQGTAEAYDLAKFGDADTVTIGDIDGRIAVSAAERINKLLGRNIVTGIQLDAGDIRAVTAFLKNVDVCCGAAHYALNRDLTQAAIDAGCHFCDLGGNTGVVTQQHALNDRACSAGVSVIPDCGLAPGLGNILAARAISKMTCDTVEIRCGGLPQNPKPPLGYKLVFSIAGLTNEYTGQCIEIRDGKRVEVPAFTECESIEFPEPVGRCEAFLTSGGTSTGADSFLGKVRNYGYKTVRYPGHFNQIRTMIDLGFLDLTPVRVGSCDVIPRDLFHTLTERKLRFPDDTDLIILRVTATGSDDRGHDIRMIQDMMDFYDEETGFSAMERTTAYSATIIAVMMARKEIDPGVHCLETVVDGDRVVEELARRDIHIHSTIHPLG
jgi:lysine 6-dehydrogenase